MQGKRSVAPLVVNYYRREEIAEWFREAGLEQVRIDPDWGGRALGHVPSSVHSAVVR